MGNVTVSTYNLQILKLKQVVMMCENTLQKWLQANYEKEHYCAEQNLTAQL